MFNKRKVTLIVTILLILVITITGCSKGSKKTSGDVPQEYTTAYEGEISTLNYLATATTSEFALAANLVDTLVDYDKYGVVQPCLATEWELSDDALVWTFKLREGVKWVTHEGKEYAEVTAQDRKSTRLNSSH